MRWLTFMIVLLACIFPGVCQASDSEPVSVSNYTPVWVHVGSHLIYVTFDYQSQKFIGQEVEPTDLVPEWGHLTPCKHWGLIDHEQSVCIDQAGQYQITHTVSISDVVPKHMRRVYLAPRHVRTHREGRSHRHRRHR